MNGDPLRTDETDPQLPGPLRAELSRVFGVDASASPGVDQKILSRARAHFARRGWLRLLLEVGAIAAVIVLAVWVVHPRRSVTPHVATAAEDINGDGVVDIRDALALERALNDGAIKGYDVNRDGVTDRRDVDAVAMLAVRLDRGATR
jgi:Dockerin type I domain